MHVCMGWKKRFVSLFLFIILILLTAKDIVANMMNLSMPLIMADVMTKPLFIDIFTV